ncbi:hypothetical protein FACS189483_08850 [Spirochaetia bacterium]|nr:hypothetical protein FACS189483_08850 [Spirochaetia bacterium]
MLIPLGLVFGRDVVVTVEDADIGIPLEGATIRSWDGTEYTCDEQGRARVTIPDNRQVVIQAAYPGYENRRLTVSVNTDALTVGLRLGGIMENRELVVEAQRPGTSETQSGRSVTISGPELARTAEIGIIEDVMTSIKLLPGVGYSGMFNAMPSIRGGDPGDLEAALDGFYLARPYYWGGGISIFDPKMVESAKLSHGVFSTRYGHTISGLLEVTSKKADPTETELDLGLATSAASLNLSFPLGGRGGILIMGKVTYWDTLVWAAKQLSAAIPDYEPMALINAVSTAPFIRSAALAGNYRFTTDLELTLNGFFGSDGVGAEYITDYDDDSLLGDDGISGSMNMNFDYHNYQGFGIAGLTYNPFPAMVLRATTGVGYTELIAEGVVDNDVEVHYNQKFLDAYPTLASSLGLTPAKSYHAPNLNVGINSDNLVFNAQARFDMDWDLGKVLPGLLLAAGVQELYTNWRQYEDVGLFIEEPTYLTIPMGGSLIYVNLPQYSNLDVYDILDANGIPRGAVIRDFTKIVDVNNHGLFSSAYTLVEYTTPNQFFGAELGIRMDHLYFAGNGFDVVTIPIWSPRLNLDFNILKNKDLFGVSNFLESFSATIGTGLFASMNENISFIEEGNEGLDDLKLNRSWTTVAGIKLDFAGGYSFNIEGYYKQVFNRAHIMADLNNNSVNVKWGFDGEGRIWGFDLQLQKMSSRYIDGWISYTYTDAQYREPSAGDFSDSGSDEKMGEWYYPSFHRFHNFNLVLNIKPTRNFSIAARFGFASGQPSTKTTYGEVVPYPVQQATWDEATGTYIPVPDENGDPVIIQKFGRDVIRREEIRGPWSTPLDIKFSFFVFDRTGKVQTEIYFAVENLLSLLPDAGETRTTYNEYTGKEDVGTNSASYDLPIPMISFGFKWSF